MTVHSSIGLQ